MKAINLNHSHPADAPAPEIDTNLAPSRFQWPETPAEWASTIREAPYRSYLYSYPHKTAYRPFDTPLLLQELWEKEELESYFCICIFHFARLAVGFVTCSLCRTSVWMYIRSMWMH